MVGVGKLAVAGLFAGALSYRPPCRKAPSVKTVTLPSGKQAVSVGWGKGWYWAEEENAHGRKHKKKEIGYFGDMWLFDADYREWSYMQVNGQDKHWNVSAEGQGGPSGRWKSEGTWVDGLGLIFFAGCTTETGLGELNDLWVMNPEAGVQDGQAAGTWRKVETINPPAIRRGHIVETNSSHLVIFGGKTLGAEMVHGTRDVCTTDLWAIPLAALQPGADHNLAKWTQGTSFPSSCRWGATGSVLSKPGGGEVLALFGGRDLNPNAAWHSTAPDAYRYFGELWFYDFAADTWTLHENDGPSPSNRDHHAATVLGGDLWVFAGRAAEARTFEANLADLWRFSLSTGKWTMEASNDGYNTPSRRFMPGISTIDYYGEEAIVMFGGEHLPGSTKKTCMNDVWVFQPNRGWAELLGSSCKDTPVLKAAESQELAAQANWQVPNPIVVSAALVMVAVAALAKQVSRMRKGQDRDGLSTPFQSLDA